MSIDTVHGPRFAPHIVRAQITSRLGVSMFSQAKSADIPWSKVQRKAERYWPLGVAMKL